MQSATGNTNGVAAGGPNSGAVNTGSDQIGTGDGVAYSGLPLAGHGGAYKDYFVAPGDSLVGTVPANSNAMQGMRIYVNQSTTSAGDSATTISASTSQSDGSIASESLGYGTTNGNWYLNLAVGSTSLNISASGISVNTTPTIGTIPTMSAAQYQAIMALDGPSPTSINGDLSSSVMAQPSSWVLLPGQVSATLPPIDLGDVASAETITPGALAIQAASIPPVDIAVAQVSPPAQQMPFMSTLYNALSSEYRQSEKQANQAGQWINGKAQQSEQFLDQLRSNIAAYGDNHGFVASVVARNIADTIGISEGAAIGAYKMGAGMVSLANGAAHLASAYSWAMDPQSNIQRLKTVAGTVAALNTFSEAVQTNPLLAWTLAKPVVKAATADYRGYLAQRDYSKFFGRAGFDVATIAGGVVGGIGKLGEGADVANAFERAESVAVPDTAPSVVNSSSNADQIALAQQRQYQMLQDNVGYNISPTSWNQYPTIGLNGTYLTDQVGISQYLGDLSGQSEITISSQQASDIESGMGLNPGSLQDGFVVRQVTGITDMNPTSPFEGNSYFQGPGNHLPNGSPEMVVSPIPTVDNPNVTTVLTVHVK